MAYAKKQLAYYREMMGIPDTSPADLVLKLRSWPSTRRESPARDCHESALVIEEQAAEIERLTDKALRFDLDAAGIAQRESEAVELVELRAKIERMRALLREAIEREQRFVPALYRDEIFLACIRAALAEGREP
jgi:predicted nucleotidyltransferase